MYCSQCGKEISESSKFCSNCGCPISEEEISNTAPKQQSAFDAVKDIQKKLREIDNRKKPPVEKSDKIKSALDVVRGEVSALELIFSDTFESQKLADKKQLILDYPFPTSPKALASLAKYINSEIAAKKKEPDELTEVWKEKLRQVYLYAESEFSTTKEFAEIQKCQKTNKRRERHATIREFIVLLILPIIMAFIASIVLHWPLLMFVSILAAGWELFLILHVYDVLEDMIESIKQHSSKQNIPKWLRSIVWHLLVPVVAALITAIVYHSVALIWVFGVGIFVQLLFLCYIYDL